MAFELSDLIPSRSLVIYTTCSPEEIERRLTEHVDTGRQRAASDKLAYSYRGEVGHGRFKMWRITETRGSLVPMIEGRVEASPGGARVHVEMRLHIVVTAFMIGWITSAGIGAVIGAIGAVRSGTMGGWFTLVLPAMGLAAVVGAFLPEANKTERFLLGVLPQRPMQEGPYR